MPLPNLFTQLRLDELKFTVTFCEIKFLFFYFMMLYTAFNSIIISIQSVFLVFRTPSGYRRACHCKNLCEFQFLIRIFYKISIPLTDLKSILTTSFLFYAICVQCHLNVDSLGTLFYHVTNTLYSFYSKYQYFYVDQEF